MPPDNGYFSEGNVNACAAAGINPVIAMGREAHHPSLDERFAAVVPVCSVGTYGAYLKAACCVCEMLPGALTFTEEGDVLERAVK